MISNSSIFSITSRETIRAPITSRETIRASITSRQTIRASITSRETIRAPITSREIIRAVSTVVLLLILCDIDQVNSQTRHILMRRPLCNSLIHEVPAALFEGVGGYIMGTGLCDITLTTPARTKWMLKIDKASILDCDVSIHIYDTYMTRSDDKSVLRIKIGCASADPGVVYTNTSTITISLNHNNSTDYSFNIIATAHKMPTKPDIPCTGFKCDTGACVAKSLICDTIDNCFDYSDESNNGTAQCQAGFWQFKGENWGVLASVLGGAVVFGVTAACCRHIRNRNRSSRDELYELNEGPYVHKYAYRYAIIRAPKKPNKTNVVLGRDGG